MESNASDAASIGGEIEALKAKKIEIDARIAALEAQLAECRDGRKGAASGNGTVSDENAVVSGKEHDLTPDMIYRYSRQLLLPSFGVKGIVQGRSRILIGCWRCKGWISTFFC